MSTYGLEIQNAAGNTVIDSTKTWKFMDVISKTTGSSVTGYNPSTDLVLVNFTSTSDNTYGATLSGTTLSFKSGVGSSATGSSVSLKYVHLRTVNNQSTDSSTYGLEIYGSDGTLVFDSARLKNVGKMEPQRLYKAGTIEGSQQIGIAGSTFSGREDFVSIDISVPYPSGVSGSYFYYEVKNDGKLYFNSFIKSAGGTSSTTNPCDVIVYEDVLPSIILLQLPPGDDGVF